MDEDDNGKFSPEGVNTFTRTNNVLEIKRWYLPLCEVADTIF